MDTTLHSKLVACGCNITGVDSNGNVSWAEKATVKEDLVKSVIAAHDTMLSCAESVALREHLGAESAEWAAYLEARKQPVAAERARRYAAETDSLFMKAWELDGAERDAALAAWKAAKGKIREELPYPE